MIAQSRQARDPNNAYPANHADPLIVRHLNCFVPGTGTLYFVPTFRIADIMISAEAE